MSSWETFSLDDSFREPNTEVELFVPDSDDEIAPDSVYDPSSNFSSYYPSVVQSIRPESSMESTIAESSVESTVDESSLNWDSSITSEARRIRTSVPDSVSLISIANGNVHPFQMRPPKISMFRLFTKGLPVDKKTGRAYKQDIQTLITALNKRQHTKLPSNLETPEQAWIADMVGEHPCSYHFSRLPVHKPLFMAGQMGEIYAMRLLAHVPFAQYSTNDQVQKIVAALRKLPTLEDTTVDNLFRGPLDDARGPYLSRFLLTQKYPGRYIITGNDLSEAVRPTTVVDILHSVINHLEYSQVPLNIPSHMLLPGDIHLILDMIVRHASLAAQGAKWSALTLLPEEYARAIDHCRQHQQEHPDLTPELMMNPLLKLYYKQEQSLRLAEDAPFYPSGPSLTATLAGAGITVIKYFFDMSTQIKISIPSADGSELVPTNIYLSIQDELHKLGSNMGLARCWRGHNFRHSMTAGLKLGEKAALAALKDLVPRYHQPVTINKFTGTAIVL